MTCPFFELSCSVGVCNALGSPYIPGIDWMGGLCFRDDYPTCYRFKDSSQRPAAKETGARPNSRTKYHLSPYDLDYERLPGDGHAQTKEGGCCHDGCSR